MHEPTRNPGERSAPSPLPLAGEVRAKRGVRDRDRSGGSAAGDGEVVRGAGRAEVAFEELAGDLGGAEAPVLAVADQDGDRDLGVVGGGVADEPRVAEEGLLAVEG